MIYNIVLVSVGLLFSLLLFTRFPLMQKRKTDTKPYRVSVIIPARNEENSLPLLLGDLQNQLYLPHEVICVDDDSTDRTAAVASSFGVRLLSVEDKPNDWTGKAFACQQGGEAAEGELLLFLDADVRLSPDAIESLVQAYEDNHCVISAQPYHQTQKDYEQFSLFFNLVQVAANATTTRFAFQKPGLFGPVILFDSQTYQAIEGHVSAKSSIVDDLALGKRLSERGFPFKLFLGGNNISFRMYGGGFSDLLQGWTKNYATGALKTPLILFLMVFIWVAACTAVTIFLAQAIIGQDVLQTVIFGVFYLLWMAELFRISTRIGGYKKYAVPFFPIYMAFFLGVMLVSLVLKLFSMNVVWKGRKIKLEK